jgi:quinol monooxygenase YgiN
LGKRRLIPLSMFVFLLVAALSSFAGPAGAQPDQRQYVVTYVEFKPADTKTGGRVLDDLAAQGRASVGVIRFDVLQQVDRRNFFALFEIWSSAQTFEAFKSASATQAILTQLAPLLAAPLDERDGNLLDGTVNPRSRHAESRQIFVITHVDIDPQFVAQALPVLDTFVSDSANDPGVQTFAAQSVADHEPLSAHRGLRKPAGIRRPRERSAHAGFPERSPAVHRRALR